MHMYMNNPKISVIVPVYNVEKYIERCVRTLFTNTIALQCEFIFIDDCSPDDSINILKYILNRHSELANNVKILLSKSNRGSAAARNLGLYAATGKYVICVDSDDWVEPDYLEKLYLEAESTEADIVGCDYFRDYVDHVEKCKTILDHNPKQVLIKIISGEIPAFLWIKLFKRSLFLENKIIWIEGLDVTEDVLICSKLFAQAQKIAYVDIPLYHYNLTNQNSLTNRLNEKKIKQIIQATDLLEQQFALNSDFEIAIKKRKILSKMWILQCADNLKPDYFSLWNDAKLYKTPKISVKRKIVLWLCCYKLSFIVNIFLRLMKTNK